jgi:hypothetical protein
VIFNGADSPSLEFQGILWHDLLDPNRTRIFHFTSPANALPSGAANASFISQADVSGPLSWLLVRSPLFNIELQAWIRYTEISYRLPVHDGRAELQSYAELSVRQWLTVNYFRLRPNLA